MSRIGAVVLGVGSLFSLGLPCLRSLQFSAKAESSRSICVRIDSVEDAPGFWSGTLAATQMLHASVISTSTSEYKFGEHLTFGMSVVQGDKLSCWQYLNARSPYIQASRQRMDESPRRNERSGKPAVKAAQPDGSTLVRKV
jgi:hypothetical protein